MKRLQIDERYCKGCGLCLDACPRQLLETQESPNAQGVRPAVLPAAKEARCTSCALCARICPDTAIRVFRVEKSDDASA